MSTKFFLVVLLAYLTFTNQVVADGVLLRAGDSYTFEFKSIEYQRPAQPRDFLQSSSAQFLASFTPSSLSLGDSVMLEAFPTALSDVPVSAMFAFPEDPNMGFRAALFWFGSTPFWPDLQGFGRVTMLTGDAELNGFGVRQVVNGSFYEQVFPVPEPSTHSMFCLGMLASISAIRAGKNEFNPLSKKRDQV